MIQYENIRHIDLIKMGAGKSMEDALRRDILEVDDMKMPKMV